MHWAPTIARKLIGAQKGAVLYAAKWGSLGRSTYGTSSGVDDGNGGLHDHGRVVTSTVKALEGMGILEKKSSSGPSYKSIPSNKFSKYPSYRSILVSEQKFGLTVLGKKVAALITST